MTLLEKHHFFVPEDGKFGYILTRFLTGRKQKSLEALGHEFYGSIAKRTLQKRCIHYQKVHGQTKEGEVRSHHSLNTPLVAGYHRASGSLGIL